MRYLILLTALTLAACDSTPTDLIMDPPPRGTTTSTGGGTTTSTETGPLVGFELVTRSSLAGAAGHRVSGDVLVYRHADGRHIVRFENLDSQSGPDLHVWLVDRFTGDVADGHETLGPLRSTRGDQNYEVRSGVNPTAFAGVSIWCENFGVDFGHATFNLGDRDREPPQAISGSAPNVAS